MLELRILGPLEVLWNGAPVGLPGTASRRVLAMLAVAAPRWLTADQLVEELWVERGPAGARKALQMHVLRLRRALAAASPGAERVLASGAAGYRLELSTEQLDARGFERLVGDASVEADPRRARELALAALDMWRGVPLLELGPEGTLRSEVRRLEELRLAALELRIEADLNLGRHGDVVGELRQLTAVHPWRERLHAQAMIALYRAGRQAEALEAFRQARAVLVEQLGIEPGPELRSVHDAVLAHDPALQAPRRAAERRAGGLPAPATRLIGRAEELRSLMAILSQAEVRLVTLTGPGGVGKTRLALEAAGRLDAAFRGGAHFAELAAIEHPDDVASAVAHALGVEPTAGEAPEDALRRFVGPAETLVVLDNLEHLRDAIPPIVRALLSGRGTTVLATSRQALRLRLERCIPISPLSLDSAVELFTAEAQRHDPGFAAAGHAAAVSSICRRLDGLPLAIELAAARMRILSPPALEQRLGDALSALPRGSRDAPQRQHTLRSTLDWSYRLLEPEEQQALARLAVFAGGATVEAAEAVTGVALDTLDALVDKSLLAHRIDRVSMLETVRQYSAERLVELNQDHATRRRHLEHFIALAAEAAPHLERRTRRIWMTRVSAELANFRGALGWAIVHEPARAVVLAGTLASYWLLRKQSEEGRRWIRSALDAAHGHAAMEDNARALLGDARLAERVGDLAVTRRSALQALALYRSSGNPSGMAGSLLALAATHVAMGRRDRGLAFIEQASSLARSAGDEVLAARSLREQALATSPLGPAVSIGDRAVEWTLHVGNREDAADLLDRLAQRAVAEGDYALSSGLFDRYYALKSATRDSGPRQHS